MTLKKRRIILILCTLFFLAALPVILLYSLGYHLNSKLQLVKTGGIYISSPVSGSQIFVDNKLEKETNILQDGLFLENLKPGTYSILVGKQGYWPWAKELKVKEQFVTEARALILPKNPEGKVLLKENFSPLESSKYEKILGLLKNMQTGTTTEILERFSNHEREKLWWNPKKNTVWVEWLRGKNSRPYYMNENKILVLNSQFSIRNAEFYPGRNDVIIVAVQNGIFAVEIDERGGKNMQPIYKGKKPFFTTYKKESAVYILEEGALIKIKL